MEVRSLGLPGIQVSEKGEEVIVKINVSGVDEKDIELEVKENSLGVDIGKDVSRSVKKKGYSSKEWKSSSFNGVVALPVKVVPMLVHHSYDGNVLEIRLKKA